MINDYHYHYQYICRHKRNLAVRNLADYRPYWFARDLRGSSRAKVSLMSVQQRNYFYSLSYSGLPPCQSHLLSLGREIERHEMMMIV